MFDAGKAGLSATGKSAVQALAAYMDATKGAKLRVDGYGDKQVPGARRSAAVRAALIAAGVPKARASDGGGKGAGTKGQAAVVTVTL
ncbi:hypothetical protein [Pseudoxanthomonas sp.]|uniref:OmpA family protein n=1 Tax=Pseudoxanthomonas sp. TaxID=1871049 RepID=UPI00261A26D2|nr:hypothetical protein [Pseudoxanthomonas sp.]WDS35627.1 MAG: hypothetical protein O8I58_15020 [Pseudoxanthomonas sp.]